jgi:site-specific DNA recombinase
VVALTNRLTSELLPTIRWRRFGRVLYRSIPIDPSDPQSKKKLAIVPEEADVVREAFALYADGMAPKAIASLFNERGIPSPGSRWNRTKRRTKGSVHGVLVGTAERSTGIFRNESYAGKLVWNRRRSKRVPGTSKRLAEVRPRSEWVVVDAPELRIVGEDVWARVRYKPLPM